MALLVTVEETPTGEDPACVNQKTTKTAHMNSVSQHVLWATKAALELDKEVVFTANNDGNFGESLQLYSQGRQRGPWERVRISLGRVFASRYQ